MSPRNRKRGSNRPGKPQQQNRRRRANRAPQRPQGGKGFWGDAGALPAARKDVRITEDPSAVARSLGPPPLPGHERIAEHYFTAVYDRAVTLAGALAAAGGLMSQDELEADQAE